MTTLPKRKLPGRFRVHSFFEERPRATAAETARLSWKSASSTRGVFIMCARNLCLHIKMAEKERWLISERTKARTGYQEGEGRGARQSHEHSRNRGGRTRVAH